MPPIEAEEVPTGVAGLVNEAPFLEKFGGGLP